jgi:adenylate kinase
MRVICTGQSGLKKQNFLQEVQSVARRQGKDVHLFSVGDLMHKLYPGIPPGRILNLEKHLLDELRHNAFQIILDESQEKENVIVNTHITMRWGFGLFPAFDFSQFTQFNPDMYITLIDDVDAIKLELSHRDEPQSRNLALKDIMVWREEELVSTEIVARTHSLVGKKDILHYVVATGHSPRIIYELMFEGHKKRVYASFPMTLVQEQPDILRKIKKFREELKKHFIVFDPATISEKRLHGEMIASLEMIYPRDWFEIKTAGKAQKLSIWEVISIIHDIDGQIIARDYKMIDQSDMIIAFVPAGSAGQPSLHVSPGVERELQYAHETGKEVFIVCPKPGLLSPFQKGTAEVFRTFEELISEFKRRGYLS